MALARWPHLHMSRSRGVRIVRIVRRELMAGVVLEPFSGWSASRESFFGTRCEAPTGSTTP
jgi:hypothetical protein